MSNQPAQPSPEHFFMTATAYQQSAALKGAIELDVFTAIAEGTTTAKALAEKRNTSERGMRILCDFLVVIGFLTKQDGKYGLTLDSSVFLDRRSPAYLGGAVEFLQSSMLFEAHNDIAGVVRKGGTLIGEEGSVSDENPVWVKFARAMASMMTPPAQTMAQMIQPDPNRKFKVLDIAAGHGIFGVAFAQRYPNVEVVAVDWAPVLEVAKENAGKFGVIDRYTTRPGSAFEVDFGDGYDLALLTNFLHHFDVETCESLLKKVHAALNDGGRVMTLEFVPNEDRVTPPNAAGFAMTMLATTRAGDAYTFAEFEKMFSNAGFKKSELRQAPPSAEQLVISYK
jgi:ubiquinone/menaquinone biosynthesis C-methylase UbiE